MLTFVFLLLASSEVLCSAGDRVIPTKTGPVHGETVRTRDPRTDTPLTYTSYKNVPFAKPPVGDLRFAAPQPLSAGEGGNMNSNVTYMRACYQLGNLFGSLHTTTSTNTLTLNLSDLLPNLFDSDEDCLYLHVHVPVPQEPQYPLPVMIWFTGGAFIFGRYSQNTSTHTGHLVTLSGSGNWYGPKYWMSHDVILVTVNYRVGPFGFLSFGVEEVAGNQGLLDQRMAMVWVQENIASFGGDPERVTIAGQSAGSFSVFYHMISPGSAGLYSRIIGQSGMAALAPAFHHWAPKQASRLGNEIAIGLGCFNLDINRQIQCMKEVSPLALSGAEFANGLISQPVFDRDYLDQPFFPIDPAKALETGHFTQDVDVLLGCNAHDGLLATQIIIGFNNLFFNTFFNNWDRLGPVLLFHKHTYEVSEKDKEMANLVLAHYTGTLNVTTDHIPNITRWAFTLLKCSNRFTQDVHRRCFPVRDYQVH